MLRNRTRMSVIAVVGIAVAGIVCWRYGAFERKRESASRSVDSQRTSGGAPSVVLSGGIKERPGVCSAATGVVERTGHLAVDPRIETITDGKRHGHERLSELVALNHSGARIAYREDLDLVIGVVRDRKEDDTLRHEAANLLMRHDYPGLVATFLGIMEDKEDNPRFRSFAAQYLWRLSVDGRTNGVVEIASGLRKAMKEGPLLVRREALLGLVRNGDKEAVEYAVRLLDEEKEDGMRDLVVRCVRECGMTNRIDRIREIAEKGAEAEKIAALVTLGSWRDADSAKIVEAACESKNERVRRTASAVLAVVKGRSRE